MLLVGWFGCDPDPDPDPEQVIYQLPAPVACCKANCSDSGVSDCANGASRTIATGNAVNNARTIHVQGVAETRADSCYANGAIVASFSDGNEKIFEIPCQTQNKIIDFDFDLGGQKTGQLTITIAASDWCTIVHSLTVTAQ